MIYQVKYTIASVKENSKRVQSQTDTHATVGHTSTSKVRVRYAETDQMGVAYYANYLVWFEVGRSQFCNDCGFSYRDMERETGLFLIVAEASCRYKTPARYEDDLTIRTTISELTRRTIRFSYEIERADGANIAAGETLHVLINSEGRPSTLPDKFRSYLRGDFLKAIRE